MDQTVSSKPYDVEAIRRDFPILSREVYGRPLVYLDGASAQKPQAVLDAINTPTPTNMPMCIAGCISSRMPRPTRMKRRARRCGVF
jgi:hypothetical protein